MTRMRIDDKKKNVKVQPLARQSTLDAFSIQQEEIAKSMTEIFKAKDQPTEGKLEKQMSFI